MILKLRAFEYLVFKMTEWCIQDQHLPHFTSFGQANNFSREKVLLLPFFACTANGIREQMFSVFDNFYAAEFGHCEKDIANGLSSLQYLKPGLVKLEFTDGFLQKYGQDASIGPDLLSDLCPEQAPIFKNIDYTIEKLKERSKDFVQFDAGVLRFYSQRHISWRTYWAISKQKSTQFRINPTVMIKEASMFANEAEKRILA